MDIKNQNRFVNVSLILTVIPAYIYFSSFMYELGICSRYGIPQYFISPNLTTVLIFATSIWGVFFSSIKLIGFSTPLFKALKDEDKKHLRVIYLINGICLIICVLIFYAYPFSWHIIFILFIFTLFMNVFSWGLPLLFRILEKKSTKDKLMDIQNTEDEFDILPLILSKLPKQERVLILVLIMIPAISYYIGDGQALKQKNYQIVVSKSNLVVLKKYDDLLICSNFNPNKKLLGDSIVLIKIDEREPIVLKTLSIGPLKKTNDNRSFFDF